MLKTNKRAFTLVEVLCSLAVFSIIFVCMMSYEATSLNMKKDIKTVNNDVLLMENLKNNIIYSMTYEDLNQLITNKNFFVSKNNITMDANKMIVKNIFINQKPTLNSYIKLTSTGIDSNVYKLNISLYSINPTDKLELQCNFYKGKHR
ncbi:prepilin-type N-terminal cleavage/methylation domain-containing protein [Clostridium lacusfryxellense]|uniref:prepilin-type N-terminal cleavage/methylation domain-containing protein n=1 Tax=Clostridium lacusfryxellense TaxID=205328 RepID=UPI001C0D5DE9|nr:prepilin-type N-terminal cleavage/methylation domain-containing protein [Clostridium lacusfryxellense]MBU3111843.1 prepilin-type N-terminal cleavage/methylation domain-containing protein [Clostridium lacusfryxellense]